jgi:hypothetical protein
MKFGLPRVKSRGMVLLANLLVPNQAPTLVEVYGFLWFLSDFC